jgi:formylglycine-generating enzyme required for sulfatase activity
VISGSGIGTASSGSSGTGSTGMSGSAGGTGSSGSSGSGLPDAGVDAGVVVAPSCAPGGPGMTNCGAGGSGTESCCTSLEVTGGTYYRTYRPDADGGATELADPATVSGFRLDKYLVTVGRFRQFVNAWNGGNGYTPPPGAGKHTYLNSGNGLHATGGGNEPGWVATDDSNIVPTNANLACGSPYDTWTNTSGSQENLPINCVNWWESYAFCIWDGGFLPSEAEYEYAAAGGSQQREYPWGSTAPAMVCPGTGGCQYAICEGCYCPNGSGNCTGVENIAPVGTATLGAGVWGQLDLAGDVWEWNLDWFAAYSACADCADLLEPAPVVFPGQGAASSDRVIRGGDFSNTEANLLPPDRYPHSPAYRGNDVGFRCARTP